MSLIDDSIRLDAIHDFLLRVGSAIDAEYAVIINRAEAGEYPGIDDLSNALFSPRMSEEIAVRATLGELNALVESRLQGATAHAFFECNARSRPSQHRRSRFVWDCNRTALQSLAEEFYGFKIADLPCADSVDEVRRTVNAYKHRGGVKEPRIDYPSLDKADIPSGIERFQLDRQRALALIGATGRFLRGLRKVTREKNRGSLRTATFPACSVRPAQGLDDARTPC